MVVTWTWVWGVRAPGSDWTSPGLRVEVAFDPSDRTLTQRDPAAVVRVERALVEALARAIVRELQADAERVSFGHHHRDDD
jgi:hypothetical protein